MGHRRGVAATLVSVILFTSILFANAALFSAENGYLASVSLSTAQQREYDYGSLLVGLAYYSSLATVQEYLQTHSLSCSAPADAYLDSLGGSQDSAGSDQGVRYSMQRSWSYASEDVQASSDSEVAMVAPFGGFSPGALNIAVSTSLNESELGGLPVYEVHAVQDLHLPVPIGSDYSLCASALSALGETLSTGRLTSCNDSSVSAAVALVSSENAYRGYVQMGASAQRGSALGASAACEVDYWVTLTVEGIQGVSGTFDWTVAGSGSLSA